MAKSRLASNKSLPTGEDGEFHLSEKSNPSRLQQVEEAKGVLRLFPIWSACLMFAVISAQSSTFFTKQGATLNRSIGGSFILPPAALQSIIGITVLIFIPIYDRVFVPTTRKFSGLSSGITMLQRIGIGMFLSMISMVIAALVEMKRLKTAKDYGLSNSPKAPIPLSLGWITPQYVLFGMADVFALVGLQEFFYDQVPDTLRTLGLALYLSILGLGSFISSLLISVVNKVTSKSGENYARRGGYASMLGDVGGTILLCWLGLCCVVLAVEGELGAGCYDTGGWRALCFGDAARDALWRV